MGDSEQSPATQSHPTPPVWAGFIAGAAGAAIALGFGELVEGASDTIPSLVVAVGELVADYTPGDVVAASIANLGTSQKTVLAVSITLLSLLIGGMFGRFTVLGMPKVTLAGFAAFGLIGGWAAARNPFSPAPASWIAALSAAALGALVTIALAVLAYRSLHTTPTTSSDTPEPSDTPTTSSDTPEPSDTPTTSSDTPEFAHGPNPLHLAERRAFLTWAGGAAAAALALTGMGRRLRGPSAAESAREAINLSPRAAPRGDVTTGAETATTTPNAAVYTDVSPGSPVTEQIATLDTLDEVNGITAYISPNSDFYRIDTALSVPHIDPKTWSLRFTGMVDSPYELTLDEILTMDLSDHVITLSCVSNQVGGNLVGNAVWTGVPLADLLDRAGVQQGATQVVGRSVDDWTAGFPTEVVYDGRNAVLAVGMNGEPLPIDHGFPARLVVAGLYGYVSAVKWIEEINLTTWDGFDAYWVPRGWSKEGPMKTQSRIDVPSGSRRLTTGVATPIAGVAWAPTRGISAVEVRIDDGDWEECEIGEALGNESWVQWTRRWTPDEPGRHYIQARATDGLGRTQSQGPVSPRPNGAEGWHTVIVSVGT